MAMKDWKRLKTKHVPTWKRKTGEVLFLYNFEGSSLYFIVLKKGRKETNLEQIRTKSKALKFAKNYMRKN